jgi:hypothetical protein
MISGSPIVLLPCVPACGRGFCVRCRGCLAARLLLPPAAASTLLDLLGLASASDSVERSRASATNGWLRIRPLHRCGPPWARMTRRSIMCCNWRTLPGQVWSHEGAHAGLGDGGLSRRVALVVAVDELRRAAGRRRCVRAAGGHFDADDVEAVPEIFAELASSTSLAHVLVRGGDDADVNGFFALGGAEGADLFLLQEAEELGNWKLRSMSPISSRKTVPPWAASKTPDAVAVGAGEGSAHGAEELAFDERRREDRSRPGRRACRSGESGDGSCGR